MMDKDKIARAISLFLEGLGVEPDEAVIRKTASRVSKAWVEDLVKGYSIDPGDILCNTWAEGGSEIVVIKDIEFTSVCRDHLLPFAGVASVAYLPDRRITGLSKIADLVECLSRRLQIQETLTEDTLAFDYRIRSGPATVRNAIKVLAAENYPPEVVAAAEQIVRAPESGDRTQDGRMTAPPG